MGLIGEGRKVILRMFPKEIDGYSLNVGAIYPEVVDTEETYESWYLRYGDDDDFYYWVEDRDFDKLLIKALGGLSKKGVLDGR